MESQWIEPDAPDIAAEYWVTRRQADCAPGYGHNLPDIRERYRWLPPNGLLRGSWITGYIDGVRGREACRSCLHSNNGWRIESRIPPPNAARSVTNEQPNPPGLRADYR